MKLKHYFLALSALLSISHVSAAIVEREKPDPSVNPIDAKTDGTYMYMYNVGAGQFFCGGNEWKTRASIGTEGYKMYFKQYTVDGAWDGKTVELWDFAPSNSYEKALFIDNEAGVCWVDRAGQPNYLWNLTKNPDNGYYRLSMAAANPDYSTWYETDKPGTYFGWDAALNNGTNTRLWAFLDPTVETNHVDWAFISEEDYQAHQTALEVFNASEPLKEQLLLAASMGVTDISTQEAVYNNMASTIDELNNAYWEVRNLNRQYEEQTVTADNPVDKTSLIVNPEHNNNQTLPWDIPAFMTVNYGVAESYNQTFNHYQSINDIPNGVYALTVRGFFRPYSSREAYKGFKPGTVVYGYNGSTTQTQPLPSIYAGASTDSLGVNREKRYNGYYLPENLEAASYYLQDAERGPKYDVTVMFYVEYGYMTIGVKQESLLSQTDWSVWDNWRLTYYGNSADAYQKWMEQTVANAPDYSNAAITQSLKEEYTTLLANMKATNATEATANTELLNAMLSDIKTNEAAWETYAKAVDRAKTLLTQEGLDSENESVQSLKSYVEKDAISIAESKTLGTNEILAEAGNVEYKVNEIAIQSLNGNSVDVTDLLLTNYDFENTADGRDDDTGWEGSWTAFGGTDENQCMEAYGMTFDVHQEAKGAPVGIYEVSLQGFFRIERGQSAYDLYLSGDQLSPGGVYVNNNMNLMKCVFDEPVRTDNSIFSDQALATGPESNPSLIIDAATGDSLYFPNNMLTAGEAFAAGMYVSKARGLVAKAGDELRIGVKGSLGSTTWAIWDNFKVVYHGKQPEYVKSYLEDAVANANDNLNKRIGKEIKEALTARIATGEAALANGDGEVMFNALVGLYDISDSTQTSISTINPVYLAAKELLIASKMSMGTQREEAATLAQTIMDGIEAYAYKTDEMAELLNQIQNMKWQLPPVNGGSDQSGNYFCIASEVEFFKGLDMKLPIFMLNDDDITAFQCDIYLPEGLRLKMNEDEDYNITLSERATSSHSVATSDQADGSIRVAVYSSKSKPFRENIGELFTLDLEYVEGATDPQLVEIRNIYLSTADEREFNPNNISSVVTIKDYTLGDVNNDGIIELYDAAYISQYLRKDNPWDFTFPAADTDADGKISIGDLVGVLNIVLGNGIVPPTDDDENQTANTLSIKDFEGYRTQSVPVSLVNKDRITAYQCDIHLPEGLKIWENVFVDNRIRYNLSYSSLPGGILRCVAYSETNEPFEDNGELFSLRIENAGTYEVKISNIRMSTAEGHEFGAPDASATLIMKDFTPGDVNNDGFVSLLDQVAKLNAEMGKPCAGYVEIAGEWYDIPNLCLYNDALPANGEGGVEQTDNVFKVEDTDVLRDYEFTLPIRMTNKDSITAFQCDIYLPEGLESVSIGVNRSYGGTTYSTTRPDGAIRWIFYNDQNVPFLENDGDLLNLTLTAKEGAAETQTVEIRNIRLVTPDEREFTPADISATLTLKDYMRGDANNDGFVSLLDFVTTMNAYCGNPSENFVSVAVDGNGNKEIDTYELYDIYYNFWQNTLPANGEGGVEQTDNVFSMEDVETYKDLDLMIPVYMDNRDAITAYQCDIYCSEGLQLTSYDTWYRLCDKHSVDIIEQADGAIRIIVKAEQNATIGGNNGQLLNLWMKSVEGASETQTVEIRNIRLVTPDEREFTPADITANVTVKEYLPADANGDYKISIVDVVSVVNYLLGDESDNFVFKAADMDGNGKITIVDVVAVVNTLLGNSPKMATARAIMHSDIHVADAEVEAGETTTLYVQLDNATAYTAMQFNVELPEGLSIEDVRMMGNPAHTVANNEGSIVAYSLANRTFNAGGSLMAITVKADEDFAGTAHVDFTNVRVVSSDIVETTLADASAFVIGGAYDINEATATAVKVYTDGQRIIIESPIAQAAAVVSVSGATQQVELVAGKNEVNVAAQGIYLVRIGSKNYKVKL